MPIIFKESALGYCNLTYSCSDTTLGALTSALRKRKSLPSQNIGVPSVPPPNLAAAAAALPQVVATAPAAKRQKEAEATKNAADGTGFKTEHSVRFREYQAEIWSEKFEELCTFRRFYGHCHGKQLEMFLYAISFPYSALTSCR